MKIGVLKEIKSQENRVALTPQAAASLINKGHEVFIEENAGVGSGYSNDDYKVLGGNISSKSEVLKNGTLLLKVKEPQPSEYNDYEPHHILFTYLHLAANKTLTESLIASKATFIAYESITDKEGRLPLLVPMSQIAGRLSVQIGAELLLKHHNGSGVLLGGVPGVPKGNVVILGGGIVGEEAAKIASGLGANVFILDINAKRLNDLSNILPENVTALHATSEYISNFVKQADIVVGAVLVPNGKTPILVNDALVSKMKPGSVIVDVAVDQGGSIETSEITSHKSPTVIKHGVVHYGVPNMPGAVPKTSTEALVNSTLPYVEKIASNDIDDLMLNNKSIKDGVNILRGDLLDKTIAREHKL